MDVEQLARDVAASFHSNWLTHAPFELGEITVKRVGFADIPVVQIAVACKPDAISALTPMVRQVVFRELVGAGIPNEIVEFTPTVGSESERRYTFVDCNEHSETKGKRKHGKLYHWRFEIKRRFVGYFQWGGFCNRYGRIPERGSRPSS